MRLVSIPVSSSRVARVIERGLLLALFISAAPPAAAAAEPALGYADVATDVAVLLGRAERGDAKANWLLGTRYASGRGGVRDDREAVRWFRRSAELRLAEGQYNLGIMYATGRGVGKDAAQAAYWFELAAEQGIVEAQFNIGTLYGTGAGVERDEARAAMWLERAGRAGLAEAQFNLGLLYEHGRGVARNADTARAWYRKAVAQSFAPARSRLAALRGGSPSPRASGVPEPAPADDAEPALGPPGRIFERDPDSFTIQLVSQPTERLAREFVKRFRLGPGADLLLTRKGGRRFYAVIYGEFATYAAAKAAVGKLSPALRKGDPWVRNVGVIQRAAGR